MSSGQLRRRPTQRPTINFRNGVGSFRENHGRNRHSKELPFLSREPHVDPRLTPEKHIEGPQFHTLWRSLIPPGENHGRK